MSGSKWRWLLVGTFSAAATGRKFAVSGERFTDVMKRVDVRTEVPIPPLLGELVDAQTFPLHFDRPRAFRIGDVVAAIEPLRRLDELAARLARDRDVAPAVAAARVEKIVGPGRLADALRGAAPQPAQQPEDEPPPPEVAPRPAADSGASSLDAIFSRVDTSTVAPAKAAKSGLDAFIGAMRSDAPRTVKVDPRVSRDTAATIRATLHEVALRILGHPAVAPLESCWRGLKMVVAQTPGHEDLALQIVDVDGEPDDLELAIERHVSKIDPDRPDAVFIGIAPAPSTLAWLAELAADRRIPFVVGVNEGLTGHIWHDQDDAPESPEWAALRANPGSRFLAAVANPVVLYNEPANEAAALGPPRLVLGSPAWALAAMIGSAIKGHDNPAAFMGRPGALVAPAAHEVDVGMSEPRTIPTAAFAALPAQQRAAEHGIILLGSEAGSDQLIAASSTTVAPGSTLPDAMAHSARSRR